MSEVMIGGQERAFILSLEGTQKILQPLSNFNLKKNR